MSDVKRGKLTRKFTAVAVVPFFMMTVQGCTMLVERVVDKATGGIISKTTDKIVDATWDAASNKIKKFRKDEPEEVQKAAVKVAPKKMSLKKATKGKFGNSPVEGATTVAKAEMVPVTDEAKEVATSNAVAEGAAAVTETVAEEGKEAAEKTAMGAVKDKWKGVQRWFKKETRELSR